MKRTIHAALSTTCFLAIAIGPATRVRADVLTYNLSNTTTAKGDTSTGVYNPLSIYSEPGGFGVAFLLPPLPLSLPLGGGGFFSTALTGAFPAAAGWSFVAAANNLAQNSLVVNADQVAGGPAYPCWQGPGDCVGIYGTANTSGFAVSYTGAAINNAHWIQAIATSSPATGQTSPYVDNKASVVNPYYDVPYAASATAFLDAPNRSPTQSNYWIADLYYASGGLTAGTQANPTQVTIYNGLMWGWADIWVPVNNLLAFQAAVDNDFASVANLDGVLGTDLTSLLTQQQISQLDSEFDAALAPEPGTWLFMLTGFIALARLKRRRAS
jgi:hypothetical protein